MYVNTVAMLAAHSNNRATELAGQPIPRNTLLIFNSFSVHMSDQHWRQPKQFRPERFLDEDNKVTKPDAFIPFGIGMYTSLLTTPSSFTLSPCLNPSALSGRRACLGENLARMEIFIFLVGLLQKFEFQTDDVSKLPTVEDSKFGLTLIPAPYTVRALRVSTDASV